MNSAIELESLLDQPVEAQLAANTLFSAFKCSLVLILSHNPTEQRLVLIAAAGQDASTLSPNFRHSLTRGLVGRAIRAHRSLIRPGQRSSFNPRKILENNRTNPKWLSRSFTMDI